MSIKFCLLDIFYSFFTCQKSVSLLSVRRTFVDIQEFITFDKNLTNVLILQTDQAKRSFHGALRLCSNYSEIKKKKPTYSLVGIQAGKLYCPIMAFFRIFLILFVVPIGTISVGKSIICKINLEDVNRQMNNVFVL